VAPTVSPLTDGHQQPPYRTAPPVGVEPTCVQLPFHLVRSQRGYGGKLCYTYIMPDNTTVSQTARQAIQVIDELQALYSSIVNNPRDRTETSDLLDELRDAIVAVQNILSRVSRHSEGNIRSELKQESDAKSSAQTQRFASGPACD